MERRPDGVDSPVLVMMSTSKGGMEWQSGLLTRTLSEHFHFGPPWRTGSRTSTDFRGSPITTPIYSR